jgi:protein-S-isoprenylcysteine O-methyltransferase Ste14
MSLSPSCGTTERAGKRRPRIMPPTLFLGLLVLTAALALALPTRGLDPAPFNYAGVVLIGAGVALNLRSDRQLKRAHTTVRPDGRPSALVTDGAFRLTRNPMYLGMALILAGAAVVLGSAPALICTAAFMIAVERWFIRNEEANAAAAFGVAYEDYRRAVRRWL